MAALLIAPGTLLEMRSLSVISMMKAAYPESPVVLLHDDIQLDPLIDMLDRQILDHCFSLDYDPNEIQSLIRVAAMHLRTPIGQATENSDTSRPAVLIVDDEVVGTKYLKKQLERMQSDFDVLCAANGEDALATLATRPVNVVMTDQRMPGMSGQQLLNRIRQMYPHVVRILTSAYGELDVALNAMNEGRIFRYQKKPWDAQTVLDCLMLALKEANALSQKRESQLSTVQQTYESVLLARRNQLGKLLCGLTGRTLPQVEAFFSELETIEILPPQAAHVRASEETDVEEELVTLMSEALQSRLQTLPPVSSVVLCPEVMQRFLEWIRSPEGRPNVTDDAVTHWLAELALQIKHLHNTGEGIYTFHEEVDRLIIDIGQDSQIPVLSHLLSPLTRVARPFIHQQSALVLSWSITLQLGGCFYLSGAKQSCAIRLEFPLERRG